MARITDILVPDIGESVNVEVIEILVKPGDAIKEEDSIITLEGDKATMEVPSTATGIVKEIKVKLGDMVSEGTLILTMEVEGEEKKPQVPSSKPQAPSLKPQVPSPKPDTSVGTSPKSPKEEAMAPSGEVYAGPGVRQLAHELGVDLRNVKGTGPKSRIIKQDVFAYVKQRLTASPSGIGLDPAPKVDFSKFGEVEIEPLNKIKRSTAANVHRSWVNIPHVTQFDEADITDLEEFRKKNKKKAEDMGYKLTPLVFVMKAVVNSLKVFPHFNASLDAPGENLILKKYFHLGIAVDTENGLVVPVIRDVDKKDIYALAKELADIGNKARNKRLTPADMAGSCFTISSLGGIGGTAFTPIIKQPDVAILGVSKAATKPVFQNEGFTPRLMLPLSLSYDHRVIDGALAARFIVDLSKRLSDVESLANS